jgi:tetratricopeptide (TPR) repeat protein
MMKNIKALLVAIVLNTATIAFGQDRLQELLDRYDYKTAISVIDSLAAEIGTDSTSIAEHREEVIDLALQKARCLRRLYRMQESVEVLADVLYLDQFNMELMADLAESHMQAGNTLEAFNLYGILTQMQPDNPYFKICQARILYREKQYEESIAACKAIIVQDSIPEILSMIADAYKTLGKADSAMVYYNYVLDRKPMHVPTLSKKADILLSAKQYFQVIDMSREYLNEDPDNMTMLPIYGLALYLQGSYPLSIEQFEHQRDLGDDSYAVHYYLGLNHYMMDNWPRAVEELEKAYQIDSSDVTLVYQLAHAKSHMPIMTGMESHRLNPESEKLYSKALEMLQPSPTMMHNIYGSMAMARHTIAQYAEAIKYYELSYKYNPQNISALSSIGYCYERLKNYTKALEYYERYLKLGKPGTEGYRFVELSINYVKQEKFMEE